MSDKVLKTPFLQQKEFPHTLFVTLRAPGTESAYFDAAADLDRLIGCNEEVVAVYQLQRIATYARKITEVA